MKKKIFFIMFFILIASVSAKSGQMKLLAVSNSGANSKGSIANLYLEVQEGSGRVFIDSYPLSKLDTQISTRFAKEVACNFIERDCNNYDFFYTIRADSSIVGGPSASAAIAVLTVSVLDDLPLDDSITITGTINSGGIIGPVGGILEKTKAAEDSGITKVLIPKYSHINHSNLTNTTLTVEVVEVSQLGEAIKEMTGHDYLENTNVELSPSYVATMKEISEGLCERAEETAAELYEEEDNTTALRLLERGLESLEIEEHYSAASFCFGSGLNSRYDQLKKEDLSKEQIKEKIAETLKRVDEFKNHTEKQELNTITDLETYMVVNDRLEESRIHLTDSMVYLATNKTNSSLFELAYGIERLNSAHSWSVFFNKPGKKYNLDKEKLDESCMKKIAEVEERIQYLEYYLPESTEEVRKSIARSYNDYNNGKPELCLHKASIAKAKVDLVLNNMAIDPERREEVIEDRSKIVSSIIAKQTHRGIFPILSYSYYEYGNSLKESDQYSALLYLEYALELGNLDIYFEKKQITLPNFRTDYVLLFLSGLMPGIVIGVILVKVARRHRKKR